jgi:6-pyruvoyltetrahydropterin 2'-reductase
MSKIKVAELFYSLQGEGQYLGTPSIFLRTFGCNFECAGFGMPRGHLSQERFSVNPEQHEKYEELPLVHTGCDSYASWDPRFKHLSPMLTVEAIVDKIQELLPNGRFDQDAHLILTGGEPLLGWQRSYVDLLEEIRKRDMRLTHLTFETNGTQEIKDELIAYLNDSLTLKEIMFSISSKLPSSGEKWQDAIRPEIVWKYIHRINKAKGYFKWVVSNEEDYEDVIKAVDDYTKGDINIPIYLMPAGGTTKVYDTNEKWVADLAMKHGWRYTPRLQVQLWKNAWGT